MSTFKQARAILDNANKQLEAFAETRGGLVFVDTEEANQAFNLVAALGELLDIWESDPFAPDNTSTVTFNEFTRYAYTYPDYEEPAGDLSRALDWVTTQEPAGDIALTALEQVEALEL